MPLDAARVQRELRDVARDTASGVTVTVTGEGAQALSHMRGEIKVRVGWVHERLRPLALPRPPACARVRARVAHARRAPSHHALA